MASTAGTFIFIDPGLQGALALFRADGTPMGAERLKYDKATKILLTDLRYSAAIKVFVEAQQPHGSDTSTTAFSIGRHYGQLLYALKHAGHRQVIPINVAHLKALLRRATLLEAVDHTDKKAAAMAYVRSKLGPAFCQYVIPPACKKPHDGIIDALAMGFLFFDYSSEF